MRLFFDTEFIEDGKTIELVSIGIVRDDGEEYYAEIAGVDYSRADQWVKDNVMVHLTGETKIRAKVAKEIVEFAGVHPEWWAYYADYDWVVLCQLYGRMIDLPSGWPMYCRDLKQLLDETQGGEGLSKPDNDQAHNALADARWAKAVWGLLR